MVTRAFVFDPCLLYHVLNLSFLYVGRVPIVHDTASPQMEGNETFIVYLRVIDFVSCLLYSVLNLSFLVGVSCDDR